MQKRILLLASTIGIAILFIAGAYYIAIYLPQKQKANMDIVKLELESKIEQEKTAQLKIEQENKIKEEEQQKIEQEKQQKIADEASQKAEIQKNQQSINSASISKCLANADAVYSEKVSRIKYPSTNGDEIVSMLNANRIQSRNECYK
jgi:CRISPR/Cas system-associated endonuclease Cas3-HD